MCVSGHFVGGLVFLVDVVSGGRRDEGILSAGSTICTRDFDGSLRFVLNLGNFLDCSFYDSVMVLKCCQWRDVDHGVLARCELHKIVDVQIWYAHIRLESYMLRAKNHGPYVMKFTVLLSLSITGLLFETDLVSQTD